MKYVKAISSKLLQIYEFSSSDYTVFSSLMLTVGDLCCIKYANQFSEDNNIQSVSVILHAIMFLTLPFCSWPSNFWFKYLQSVFQNFKVCKVTVLMLNLK